MKLNSTVLALGSVSIGILAFFLALGHFGRESEKEGTQYKSKPTLSQIPLPEKTKTHSAPFVLNPGADRKTLEGQFWNYLAVDEEFSRSFVLASVECNESQCKASVTAKLPGGSDLMKMFLKSHPSLSPEFSIYLRGQSALVFEISTKNAKIKPKS